MHILPNDLSLSIRHGAAMNQKAVVMAHTELLITNHFSQLLFLRVFKEVCFPPCSNVQVGEFPQISRRYKLRQALLLNSFAKQAF